MSRTGSPRVRSPTHAQSRSAPCALSFGPFYRLFLLLPLSLHLLVSFCPRLPSLLALPLRSLACLPTTPSRLIRACHERSVALLYHSGCKLIPRLPSPARQGPFLWPFLNARFRFLLSRLGVQTSCASQPEACRRWSS